MTNTHDLLFKNARTYNDWQDKSVSEDILRQLHDLTKMGPTAANSCPLRVLFLTSEAAKEKLKPMLSPGNVDKTMSAPVVALLAHDVEFHMQLPKLFPHADAKAWFDGAGNAQNRLDTAFRNGTLQCGYFIMAARSLGLGCGPMSGFDESQVNEGFFAGTTHKVNMICNLGYGSEEGLFPRSPRFEFDEVCKVL